MSAAEQWLKLELTKNFKVCDLRTSADAFRRLTGILMIAYPRLGSTPTIAGSGLVKRVFAAIRWHCDVSPIVLCVTLRRYKFKFTGYGHGQD